MLLDQDVVYRLARADEASALHDFVRTHGPNPWNYLPEVGTREEFEAISEGQAFALVATHRAGLVGVAACLPAALFPENIAPYREHADAAYIGDVVVHADAVGRGIGSELLRQVLAQLRQQGISEVLVERHEENAASAGMMRKAGFELVACFDDPIKRQVGSRRTAVLRFRPQKVS